MTEYNLDFSTCRVAACQNTFFLPERTNFGLGYEAD